MPHILDNSVVNLDILPEGKPQEMADQAGDKAEEGKAAAG